MHTKVIVIGEDPESILEQFVDSGEWDWHCIGGRWNNSIALKSGGRANGAQKCEIDFDSMDKIFGKAVVVGGEWHEKTLEYEHEWPNEFLGLMAQVKDDEVISVYDCHS